MKCKRPLLQAAFLVGSSVFSLGAQAAPSDLPNLPVGIKQGGGALIGDTVYVGLGAGNSDFYALNLKEPKAWNKLPPFPGGERAQPVVSTVDGKLFVFGGLQKNEKGELHLVNDVHCYDPEKGEWEKLPTRSPLGLVGAQGAAHDGKIYIIGGSNLSIFNGIFQDLTAAGDDKEKKDALLAKYFDQRPEDYFFNTTLFSYEPANNKWYNEGALPFSGRAGAAVAVLGDRIDVINGEIKPGLRTPEAEQGQFTASGGVDWVKLPNLPEPAKGVAQDGLAGAYIGYSHGHLLVAGGANFPGSNKQFADGQLHAHKGLQKTYQKEIYALDNDQKWSVIGKLSEGAGYGVSISYDDAVLLIGGETDGGKALDKVEIIQFKD